MKDDVFVLEEELKKLPESPGVYLMHNALDEIIYVGKAVVLKNRVRQYFQSGRGKSEKILRMVEQIAWFEYIVTDTEEEALLLECNLIKKYRPKYNTMLMDDKGYQLIEVTVTEPFPRIFSTFRERKDKNRYFGPYASGTAVRDTVGLLHSIYPIRTCRTKLPAEKKMRPCLNYDLGLCKAPCAGLITEAEYRANIDEAVRFLSGDTKDVQRAIRSAMTEAAEKEDFETAIRYRELLSAVLSISEKQKITAAGSTEERDSVGMAFDGTDAIVTVGITPT
ncbi:MAG: excinuclease ABC subunit C, partial [Clostridia bacterium]|nr:excinuclease ABC subunit C [Clostridia bacterium]